MLLCRRLSFHSLCRVVREACLGRDERVVRALRYRSVIVFVGETSVLLIRHAASLSLSFSRKDHLIGTILYCSRASITGSATWRASFKKATACASPDLRSAVSVHAAMKLSAAPLSGLVMARASRSGACRVRGIAKSKKWLSPLFPISWMFGT